MSNNEALLRQAVEVAQAANQAETAEKAEWLRRRLAELLANAEVEA